MAERRINASFQQRRDTAANWESKNPVLLDGEMITVITNAGAVRHKTGDGVKTYTQLPFDDEPLYNALVKKISNPSIKSNGQVLTYDSTAGEWVAQNPSSGLSGTTYACTIPSNGWSVSGDYYTNTVTVTGLKANYDVTPIVDCELSGTDADADNAILAAFGSIAIITTAANSITAKAIGTAPDVNVPIIINVWG